MCIRAKRSVPGGCAADKRQGANEAQTKQRVKKMSFSPPCPDISTLNIYIIWTLVSPKQFGSAPSSQYNVGRATPAAKIKTRALTYRSITREKEQKDRLGVALRAQKTAANKMKWQKSISCRHSNCYCLRPRPRLFARRMDKSASRHRFYLWLPFQLLFCKFPSVATQFVCFFRERNFSIST
jgi:hypothetical protein